MARIRSIKPGFFTSLDIADLQRHTRLHFAGLWTYADDHGRGIDDPRLIKAAIWPLDDDITTDDIERMQDELAKHDRIVRYTVAGRRYFEVRKWHDHQKPNRRADSSIPPSEDADVQTQCTSSAEAVRAHNSRTAGARQEGRGEEGRGEGGGDGGNARARTACTRTAPASQDDDNDQGNDVDVYTGGFPTRPHGETTLAASITTWATTRDVDLPPPQRRADVTRSLLDVTADHLGTDHRAWRRVSTQLVCEYAVDATGRPLEPAARRHVERLVAEHGAHAALHALAEAVARGAGLDEAHAADQRALTKYAAAVATGGAR